MIGKYNIIIKIRQGKRNPCLIFMAFKIYLGDVEFPHRQTPIPTKSRSRSVPDVVVLNSLNLWVRSLSTNVFQGTSFGIGVCLCCFFGRSAKKLYFEFPIEVIVI